MGAQIRGDEGRGVIKIWAFAEFKLVFLGMASQRPYGSNFEQISVAVSFVLILFYYICWYSY